MRGKVINIMGTSGSGKSFLARCIMNQYKAVTPTCVSGRRKPIFYQLRSGGVDAVLLGSYETECGGCDTIDSFDEIYLNVRKAADAGMAVVFEGLLLSGSIGRLVEVKEQGYDLHVALLSTSLEDCLAAVNARRRARNPEAEDVNPKNTKTRWDRTRKVCERFKEEGIDADLYDRQAAFVQVCKWLEIKQANYEITVNEVLKRSKILKQKPSTGQPELFS